MTLLHYTEARYFLLLKVGRNIVLLHSACEAHAPGFSWVGSDMSVDVQESFQDFRHAGLIEVGHHEPWGAAVSLSATGVTRLAEWRERYLSSARSVAS